MGNFSVDNVQCLHKNVDTSSLHNVMHFCYTENQHYQCQVALKCKSLEKYVVT